MKTNKKTESKGSVLSKSHWMTIVAGTVVVLFAAWFAFWPKATPQLNQDPEVLSALDAVFTAINSRNSKELERLDKILVSHHEEGRINLDAHQRVQAISSVAKNGEWELAAEQLYSFIERQQGR